MQYICGFKFSGVGSEEEDVIGGMSKKGSLGDNDFFKKTVEKHGSAASLAYFLWRISLYLLEWRLSWSSSVVHGF